MKNSNNNITNVALLYVFAFFALFKSVGFDPDSIHYYNWISNEIYKDIQVEPMFIWVSDFFVYFVGSENAYFYVNAFYVFAISIITGFTASLINSRGYLWSFYGFCYISIVLTQIRFGLCLVSIVYALLLFNKNRKFQAYIFIIFALLNHYSGFVILFIYWLGLLLGYFKINLFNISGVILIVLITFGANVVFADGRDFVGIISDLRISGRVVDNLSNYDVDSNIFKSSGIFVMLSLFYLYYKFKGDKFFNELNVLLLIGAAVVIANFNHVLHIRLFQFYVLMLHVLVSLNIRHNLTEDKLGLLIFNVYPLIYLLNDVVRNNFFGV